MAHLSGCDREVEASWNVMAHAQNLDFVFRRNVQSPFKSAVASVESCTGSRGVRINGCNAGYTMFRGSVRGTGYLLHSLVSPSLPLPCVAVYRHISAEVYMPIAIPGAFGLQFVSQKFLMLYKSH